MKDLENYELDPPIKVDQPGIYRIKVQGRLSAGLQRRFDDADIVVDLNSAGIPCTTLTSQISDQAALHGLIARIRDLGLPLILVELVSTINYGK